MAVPTVFLVRYIARYGAAKLHQYTGIPTASIRAFSTGARAAGVRQKASIANAYRQAMYTKLRQAHVPTHIANRFKGASLGRVDDVQELWGQVTQKIAADFKKPLSAVQRGLSRSKKAWEVIMEYVG